MKVSLMAYRIAVDFVLPSVHFIDQQLNGRREDYLTSRESSRYPVIPSSIESRKSSNSY